MTLRAPDALLQAVQAADQEAHESVKHVNSFVVWSFRGKTRHPELSEVYSHGFLLLTASDGQTADMDSQDCVPKCRKSCLHGGNEELGQVEYCVEHAKSRSDLDVNSRKSCYEYDLVEDMLHPIELQLGRATLSQISRRKIGLTLPLLIYVSAGDGMGHNQCTVYIGFKISKVRVEDVIKIERPLIKHRGRITVQEILGHLRGALLKSEICMQNRFDLCFTREKVSTRPFYLPVGQLQGPFISLALNWRVPLQQASSALFFDRPAAFSCSAVVYMRGSHVPDRSLLGEYLVDLHLLHSLHHAEPHLCARLEVDHGETLQNEHDITKSIAELIQEEELRASTQKLKHDSLVAHEGVPDLQRGYVNELPGRDFVHRLWFKVLSRCGTVSNLVDVMRIVLAKLGKTDGFAPFLRKDNSTEMAEVFRLAIKMSKLQRYASASQAKELEVMTTTWKEKCMSLSQATHAVSLVLGAGVESLCRDFVHIICRSGYMTSQDLRAFTDTSHPVDVQLDCLRHLHHIAELALMCHRVSLCFDTMRQITMKAVQYYQKRAGAPRVHLPAFAVPLSATAVARVLNNFPSVSPSLVIAEWGGACARAERIIGQRPDENACIREADIWPEQAASSPYNYRVTLFDQFSLWKKAAAQCTAEAGV